MQYPRSSVPRRLVPAQAGQVHFPAVPEWVGRAPILFCLPPPVGALPDLQVGPKAGWHAQHIQPLQPPA